MRDLIRSVLSVTTLFSLLLSLSALSGPQEARACITPPPMTLLELYLASDLVVLAEVKSEKFVKGFDEDETEGSIEVRKNLRVLKTYKGRAEERISVARWEYRSHETPENITGSNEQRPSMEGLDYLRPRIVFSGGTYLFFLHKRAKRRDYDPMDINTGIREVTPANSGVLDLRLEELAETLASKENFFENLAEWMTRLIEDPATLGDGVTDLNESASRFSILLSGWTREIKAPGLPLDSSGNSPEIAKHLTDSHKARISAVIDRRLENDLSSTRAADPFTIVNIILLRLAANWNKLQFSSRLYALLKNTDPADTHRISILMTYLSYTVGDDELGKINLDYYQMLYQRDPGNAGPGTDEKETEKKDTELLKGSGNETGDLAARDDAETREEAGDTNNRPGMGTSVIRLSGAQYFDPIDKEKDVEIRTDEEQGEVDLVVADKKHPEAAVQNKNESPKERGEKLLESFIARFEYLLARNFPPAEPELIYFGDPEEGDKPADNR